MVAKCVGISSTRVLVHKAAKDGTRVLLSPLHDATPIYIGGVTVTVLQGFPLLRRTTELIMTKDEELYAVAPGAAMLCVLTMA